MEPLKLIDESTPIGTDVIYVSTFGPPAARMFRSKTASTPSNGSVLLARPTRRYGTSFEKVDSMHVYALGGVMPEHEEP